jgi:homoserine O-acetyltransferase
MTDQFEMDYEVFHIENFELQSGAVLPDAQLAYKTYGQPNAAGDNVVVLPTFYTGTHLRNEGYFGPGRAIDPARHYVISINLFGNGISSSPSNTPAPLDAARFPHITLYDNVRAQHALLTEKLDVERIALVTGWSMAGCQSFQWGAQYPDMVAAILPFCASAKTSEHNVVFLEGVKAALTADGNFADGNYNAPPVRGLKAFGRVYAGWAFSQTFFREQMYRLKGFGSAEELLQDWERDHLDWDANDLLCKLWTWQHGDIGAQPAYGGDLVAALNAIRARTIVIACDNDLYFQPADNELEIPHIPRGELRIYASPWGHCVASPGNDTEFEAYLERAIRDLLD